MDTPTIPLIARAAEFRERTAVTAPDGSFSYGELLRASASVGSWLLDGASDMQESRVAYLVPPGFDYVATQWGAWRAGGIAVPLCVTHPRPELEYVVDDSGAAVLVAHPVFERSLRPIAEARGLRFALTTELLNAPESNLPGVVVDRRAIILYTSGTTGAAKGVVTTHVNIHSQVSTLVSAWEWTSEDHILNALPLHHVHGIINALTCALWVGARCEMLPRFDADQVWARLSDGDLTLYMAVPTTYKALIAAWEKAPPQRQRAMSEGCSKLRLMVSGSDALEVSTLERWQSITGHVLLERYGMTEIGMALSNPLHGERVPGHVGSPLPGVEARLVELEMGPVEGASGHLHGGLAGPGQPGEVQIKGPSVFREYWGRPEATAEAFTDDGWFCTGDVASVENGVFRIWGRASQDIIISGGENVSAKEIEQVLARHPDIEASAVVGVGDSYWGRAVSAALVLREGGSITRESLREWAKDKMAPYKIPQRVIAVHALPHNAMGKVVKPEVVKLFEAQERSPGA